HATSSPATSTFSLHDALPIFGGVLLVKLFGQRRTEVDRFARHARTVRDVGVKRAVVGTRLAVVMSLVGAVGTAVIYWVGGYLVVDRKSTRLNSSHVKISYAVF